jgi:oxalate decarboxylase/phosphoglucose isomerase-like protein (cupin superfamily)
MQKIGKGFMLYNEDVETLQFDWGRINILSSAGITGAKHFSFGIAHTLPGVGHSKHNHPDSEEVIYVLSGEGEHVMDGQPAVKIKSGACIYIPAGVYHSTANTGTGPLITAIAYGPQGAELAFKKNEDCTILPPGK